MKPGNSGGGKGPWFKTDARRRKGREIGQPINSKECSHEGLADLALFEQDYAAAVDVLAEGIESDLGQYANDTAAVKYVTLVEASLRLD